jgi:signal transduction histidine kinase/CheY-like chemotaxis protein
VRASACGASLAGLLLRGVAGYRATGSDMDELTHEGQLPKDRPSTVRGRLFRKYAAAFAAVVSAALVANGLIDIWFSYQEQRALLVRIQQGQAESSATNIGQFVKEIENQMAWATLLPWHAGTLEEWRFDAVRLLRQVPAITELKQLDADGRELFRMSRHAKDVIASGADHSHDTAFVRAMADKTYYGPVYFLAGSEPYMTLALAGNRKSHGVVVGQVNLKFIWDVVSDSKRGGQGVAYVVDSEGRLIAHPDISLVLRNTDLSRLPQVQAARTATMTSSAGEAPDAVDRHNRPMLSAHATVPALGWLVFVDLPLDEAYAPLYQSIQRSAVLLLAALALAFVAGLLLARRMIGPIRALHQGASRIGGGDLSQRIAIKTDDELEELGVAFNNMASRLQESYATLERKVEQRTRQLESANQAKSRFLAAASHDLRQPLHALGLFVGQLNRRMRADERKRIVGRIEAALAAMNELFNALLDISKLDAGVLKPTLSEFPVERLLRRAESTFADAARQKGLAFKAVACGAWVRSDFILLERIVFNLVSNAVRHSRKGHLLVGCRMQGDCLRIEVWDTGPGIPDDQRQSIFGEFYRLHDPEHGGTTGLGLGLAIVERLCRLLDHPISVRSTLGKGSCFAVSVPLAEPVRAVAQSRPTLAVHTIPTGKLVIVIDDDPLVLEGMTGLLQSWGCQVLVAENDRVALAGLSANKRKPDLIVSDYHLPGGKLGIEVIDGLRSTFAADIPAFLISGDTDLVHLRRANARGFHLLHKPVDPMALRAMFARVLATHGRSMSH